MKTDSIKKNFLYQSIYQVIVMICPLITYPYISRIFGPVGLGEYSFTNSVIYYFLIIANLGIVNYGSREIAKKMKNKGELSKTFFEIYISHAIAVLLSIILYIMYLTFFNDKYVFLFYCQILQLIATFFDVSWFFSGVQNFKVTSVINAIVKIISIISIFCFIKSKDDIGIYILILAFGNLLGHILASVQLKHYIDITCFRNLKIKRHIKQLVVLCIPIVAISLYKYMDKIMIELLSSTYQLGLYEAAEKIITIPLGVITAFGLVMLPKMSELVSIGMKNRSIELLRTSMKYSLILAIGMTFGIIAITPTLVPVFFGESFIESGNLIIALSVSLIFTTWANMIRSQYLIPNNKDKEFIVSVFIGAGINLVMNYILIPKLMSFGAVIATIFAEVTVAIMHSIYARKELNLFAYAKDIIFYIVPGTAMFMVVRSIKHFMGQNTVSLIVQISIGAIIYVTIASMYLYYKKDEIFINNLNKLKRRKKVIKNEHI